MRRSPANEPHLRRARAFWLLGAIGLVWGHICLFARIEPFYTSVYTFLWWPAIFVIDWAVWKLRGTSLLYDRPREFLLLALWSTPAWLFYEAVNFRLENWYYIQVPIHLSDGGPFLALAFATVLPGVFELMELWVGLIERKTAGRGIRQQPITVTPAIVWGEIAVGVLMLILTLAWPGIFFCLAWGFAFCILDPICYLKGGRSILGQLRRGDATRLVALLLAGFVAGGMWEGWNVFSRSKWIYTVPGFESLKLGEMPLLGFLGFPPFVLECYAMVNFVCLFRRGRHWEFFGKENRLAPGMDRKTARAAWWAIIGASFLVILGIFQWSVSSYSVPIEEALNPVLTGRERAALREDAVRFGYEFLENYDAQSPPPQFDPKTFTRAWRLSRMSELRGLGYDHAIAMEALGIERPGDLQSWNPWRLSARLRQVSDGVLTPNPRRARVWIQAAQEKENKAK